MPLSWNVSSLFSWSWLSCSDSIPYISFVLITASYILSFSRFSWFPCFQSSSSFFHVTRVSANLLFISFLASLSSFNRHPRYLASVVCLTFSPFLNFTVSVEFMFIASWPDGLEGNRGILSCFLSDWLACFLFCFRGFEILFRGLEGNRGMFRGSWEIGVYVCCFVASREIGILLSRRQISDIVFNTACQDCCAEQCSRILALFLV